MSTATASSIAEVFYGRLAEIDLSTVPVMSTDRHIPRKEQAALCRKLFRMLGLKGASVTAPRYSMASSVDVNLPRLPRLDRERTLEDMQASRERHEKLDAVLLKAFPNHNDRSELQSDYFDYCWSVHG